MTTENGWWTPSNYDKGFDDGYLEALEWVRDNLEIKGE